MPIEFKYKCPDCGWTIKWIYDEEEERLRTGGLSGCPGKKCTRLHEVSARNVAEEEAEKITEDQFGR